MIVSLVAGVLLGLLFYGALWITVRRLVVTRHPVALSLGSLLLRMAVAVSGVLLASRGRWQNTLACLLGFTIGRVVVARLLVVCT